MCSCVYDMYIRSLVTVSLEKKSRGRPVGVVALAQNAIRVPGTFSLSAVLSRGSVCHHCIIWSCESCSTPVFSPGNPTDRRVWRTIGTWDARVEHNWSDLTHKAIRDENTKESPSGEKGLLKILLYMEGKAFLEVPMDSLLLEKHTSLGFID